MVQETVQLRRARRLLGGSVQTEEREAARDQHADLWACVLSVRPTSASRNFGPGNRA